MAVVMPQSPLPAFQPRCSEGRGGILGGGGGAGKYIQMLVFFPLHIAIDTEMFLFPSRVPYRERIEPAFFWPFLIVGIVFSPYYYIKLSEKILFT